MWETCVCETNSCSKLTNFTKSGFLVCIRQRQDSLSSCNVLMGLQPNFCIKEPENNFLFCYKMSNSYQRHYLFLDCQLWLIKEAIKVNFLAGKLVKYQMVMSYRKYTCNNQRGSGSPTPWSNKKIIQSTDLDLDTFVHASNWLSIFWDVTSLRTFKN